MFLTILRIVRYSLHQSKSLQDRLGDMWTHEWPWLQLMCYAIFLLYGHDFREWEKVWGGSEYWFGVSLLNTGDW